VDFECFTNLAVPKLADLAVPRLADLAVPKLSLSQQPEPAVMLLLDPN
jgi:hypothetical protein